MPLRMVVEPAEFAEAEFPVEVGRLKRPGLQPDGDRATPPGFSLRRRHQRGADILAAMRLIDPEELDIEPVEAEIADYAAGDCTRLIARGANDLLFVFALAKMRFVIGPQPGHDRLVRGARAFRFDVDVGH